MTLLELTACVDQRWSSLIGDPTIMGWTTVICYFAGSLACFRAGWVRPGDRRFWILTGLFLLLLGLNKQLDLQSALTATGRCLAKIQGWYDQRRALQLDFILALLGLSSWGMMITLYCLRRSLRRVGLALLGCGLLVIYVAFRAIHFYHADPFVGGHTNLGVRMNGFLEVMGIGLILINTMAAINGHQRKTQKIRTADPPSFDSTS